jgi:putative endopeptidase
MRMNIFLFLALLGLTSATLCAQNTAAIRFSTNHMDFSANPKTDFFQYANGGWLKRTEIPSDKGLWGALSELSEENWKRIKIILESTAQKQPQETQSSSGKVGAFFRSGMNEQEIQKAGIAPLAPYVTRINTAVAPVDLVPLIGEQQNHGISTLFGLEVSPDLKNSSTETFYLGQDGLGMPNKDYYLDKQFEKKKEAYLEHIAKMLQLAGLPSAQAARESKVILDFETELAKASMSQLELRDVSAQYNKISLAEARKLAPNFPWNSVLAFHGLKSDTVILAQPKFFERLSSLIKDEPLSTFKTFLRWKWISGTADALPAEIEEESFRFHGTVLGGVPKMEPRWQRVARATDHYLGEALGQAYVEKYYPPEARQRMADLVANLKVAFSNRLQSIDWMSPETKSKAMIKFSRFTTKIGYPEHWRDYSKLVVKNGPYFDNVLAARSFEFNRQMAKVGKPVDKQEWLMTPPTVNAYFDPPKNEINFPAGILQPPLFDFNMDDAINYAAIGAIIGHEITHGYDDQGRKFDADGNLSDWWTEKDVAEFGKRTQLLVKQYSSYTVLDGLHVNGELTLGENIADLGGVTIALDALKQSYAKKGQPAPIDGFTWQQRFFLSWAQAWRTKFLPDTLRKRVATDPHAPGNFRASGPLVNLPEFFEAFEIKPGDPMFKAIEERSRIW